MPQAVFQGTITIPLFKAPYILTGINAANGTYGSTGVFDGRSDWTTINKRLTPIAATATANGYYGLFFKKYMMNPFNFYSITNDQTETLTGSTPNVVTSMYSSVNGNLYGLYGSSNNGVTNQAFCMSPWFMQNVDWTPRLWSPSRFAATNTTGFNSGMGVCGLANFTPFQDYCGYRLNLSTILINLARPKFFLYYQDRPYGGAARGLNVNYFMSMPDRDLLSTHFLNWTNTTFGLFHTWSVVDPIIPTVTYDDSQVTIDNGLGSAFAAWFNQTGLSQIFTVSKAPNAWLVNMLTTGSNPTPDNKVLLFDIGCKRYWKLNFVNFSVPQNPGSAFGNADVYDVHIDPTGVAYVASAKFVNASSGQIAISNAVNLPWYPVPYGQAPVFSLPCPPLCDTTQSVLSFND